MATVSVGWGGGGAGAGAMAVEAGLMSREILRRKGFSYLPLPKVPVQYFHGTPSFHSDLFVGQCRFNSGMKSF